MTPEDERLAQDLRRTLRDSENLDLVTAAKLRAARARALDAAQPQRKPWLWALPAAAAAVLVAALWLPGAPPPAATPAGGSAGASEVLDVLVDEQGPEFYQDLDLYEWLEQEATRA